MKKRNYLLSIAFCALLVVAAAALAGCNKRSFDAAKPITVVAREDGSGTKTAFMEIIGLKGKADPSGTVIMAGTAGVLAEVDGNLYSIAYESLGYVTDSVKKLKVDGVEATIANIKNGTYKIARPLSIVYKDASIASGANLAFYTFLESADAQDIISTGGYVSIKDGAPAYASENPSGLSGAVDISGSTSLQPLMIKLAEKFEDIHKNVTVRVTGGGSGTGYQNAENGTSNFGMISEEFNQTKAPSCVIMTVAKDGIAVIVHKNNTFDNITLAQLKNIYDADQDASAKIKVWNDLNQA
ncbi:MAG: substrate-binding domain-containing protein [Clostridiales bacterium]|jgi:phosphate transport system substrate-binding protein|nr:substrate-binding domain-containing protein [Clostridiales bacterium]